MVFYIIFFIIHFFSLGKSMEKIKGVNIGGWLVLEPWITPSLFYPFLGKTNKDTNTNTNMNKIGMDMYTFCEVLGPAKANKVLQEHWSSWFTEEHIQILSKNNINVLRVPIGDWMYIPYGPFSTLDNGVKCTDGAVEALDNLFILAQKYNMKVLLDLHGVKGSQNGFDNSGQALDVQIESKNETDTIHFKHWEIRSANWVGPFDIESKSYPLLDLDSINHSKTVLLHIIRKYYNYPGLYGLCVLNEPWEFTPEDFLKGFYQDIFNMFTEYMSQDKVFVIHDSFRSAIWADFELSENTKNIDILIDTHQYTAWNSPYSSYENLIKSTGGWQAPPLKYKYIIGEWSLAIDNCEMWLNGFMDNVPGYPLFECSYNPCPKNHNFEFASQLSQSDFGPFGTGESYPRKNSHTKQYDCPVSIPLSKHFPDSNVEKEDYKEKEEKDLAEELFLSKTRAFEKETSGWIFWNFRTETASYQWDYLAYLELTNQEETDNTITDEYSNKNNYYPISIFIGSIIVLLGICLYFIYLYRGVININVNTNKKNGYTVINSKQFENKNYQSIGV